MRYSHVTPSFVAYSALRTVGLLLLVWGLSPAGKLSAQSGLPTLSAPQMDSGTTAFPETIVSPPQSNGPYLAPLEDPYFSADPTFSGGQPGYPAGPGWNSYAVPPQSYPGIPPAGYFAADEPYTYGLFQHRPVYRAPAPAWFPAPMLWPMSNSQATWLPGDGDQLGILEFERHLYFDHAGMSPIQVIPAFATRYFTGPNRVDLSPLTSDLSVEFTTQLDLTPELRLDLGIRPGLYGDYEYLNADTFRLQGHAVGVWTVDSATQVVLGGTYLSREDISALPVAGLVWTPSEDLKVEAVFPRPRVAWRFQSCHELSRWFYSGMELGGGSWSVLRDDHRDVATYRDVRWTFGVETHLTSGMTGYVEIGWAFARRLAFASGADNYHPNDAPLVRAGLSF